MFSYILGMQILNMNHLYYFSVIADLGSISKASKKLHITQPALSHQLKQLENALDCKLFDRVGRSLILNSKGTYLLEFANNVFRETDNMFTKIKNNLHESAQRIIVGVEYGVDYDFVFELVNHLNKVKYLNLEIIEGSAEKLGLLLKSKKIDLILSFSAIGASEVNLYSMPIKCFRAQLVAPRRLNSTRMSNLQLLENFPVVRYVSNVVLDNLMKKFLSHNRCEKIRQISILNYQAVKELLVSGKGIGMLLTTKHDGDEQNLDYFILNRFEDTILYLNATYSLESNHVGGLQTLVQQANQVFQHNGLH